jgi:hypothetical protein
MTREEAMLKLLAVGPETKSKLIAITGWPTDETLRVLDSLLKQKRIGYGDGPYVAAHGQRRYHVRTQ